MYGAEGWTVTRRDEGLLHGENINVNDVEDTALESRGRIKKGIRSSE